MRRIQPLVLMICLIASLFPVKAFAYSGSDYTNDSILADKLTNVFNGSVTLFDGEGTGYKIGASVGNYPNSPHSIAGLTGYECFIYANAVYYYLFGDLPSKGSSNYSSSTVPVRAANRFSYELLVNNGIRCGAYVRTTNNSDGSYSSTNSHSFIILSYNTEGANILQANFDYHGTISLGWFNWDRLNNLLKRYWGGYISHIITPNRGEEMSVGYDRVIPDGDYFIVCFKDPRYQLDIVGDKVPADDDTNVNIWPIGESLREQDAFTVEYNNDDKFYTITQKGTNKALDVYGTSKICGANVQMYNSHYGPAQKWAISDAWDGSHWIGYRIQAKCSGFSLDVENGGEDSAYKGGTNVVVWSENSSQAQSWLFIPYQPEQSIPNGRYILLSTMDTSIELDVVGDSGDIPNGTNVQIWHDYAPSQFNSFDVETLNNGYYRLKHSASGKSLDVAGSSKELTANVQLWESNDAYAQQWAITQLNDGYMLRARCSGMALDIEDGKTSDGTNVRQCRYNGSDAQTWIFVPAEYKVSYNANGGFAEPETETKYYKQNLTLSSSKPLRYGYTFLGWSDSASAAYAKFQPGSIFTLEQNTTLYAVWKADSAVIDTVSHNGNTVIANITCTDNNAFVFCVFYNNSGKMISMYSAKVTSESTYQFQSDGQQFDYAKVFILDENLRPICQGKRT